MNDARTALGQTEPSREIGGTAGRAHTSVGAGDPPPAQIALLYQSTDGRLCLFEDAHGHLSVVRSENLA